MVRTWRLVTEAADGRGRGCREPQAGAPPPVSHTEGSSDSPTSSGQDGADSYLLEWAVRPEMRSTGWPGCRKGEGDLSSQGCWLGTQPPGRRSSWGGLGQRERGPSKSRRNQSWECTEKNGNCKGQRAQAQWTQWTGVRKGDAPTQAQRHFAANQGFTRRSWASGFSISRRAQQIDSIKARKTVVSL